MEPSVTAKSVGGGASLTFANATRDEDGTCQCDVSITGRHNGQARLSFQPGESCLVTFLHTAVDNPPVYRTDRDFHARGSDVGFSLGKHDNNGHLGLTIYMNSRETAGEGLSAHWRLETTLVLTPETVRDLANQLSRFFGYGRAV